MRARVGIVDDHPAVVLGVARIVDAHPDMYVAASGSTVAEMLTHDRRLDVVLLDLVLADGTTPTQNIRALDRIAPVLAYTSGERPRLVREAGRAGVIGMIRKSELPDAIVDAIRTKCTGAALDGGADSAACAKAFADCAAEPYLDAVPDCPK